MFENSGISASQLKDQFYHRVIEINNRVNQIRSRLKTKGIDVNNFKIVTIVTQKIPKIAMGVCYFVNILSLYTFSLALQLIKGLTIYTIDSPSNDTTVLSSIPYRPSSMCQYHKICK